MMCYAAQFLFMIKAYARNVRLYSPYRQYTNFFIFRFVSLQCLPFLLEFVKRLETGARYVRRPQVRVTSDRQYSGYDFRR